MGLAWTWVFALPCQEKAREKAVWRQQVHRLRAITDRLTWPCSRVVLCRYDNADVVAHIYRQLAAEGYRGVPTSNLYRDEVQVSS